MVFISSLISRTSYLKRLSALALILLLPLCVSAGTGDAWKTYNDSNASQRTRRAAFRTLMDSPDAQKAFVAGMDDRDPGIRRRSVYGYFVQHGTLPEAQIQKLAADPDPAVAAQVIDCLSRMKDKKTATRCLRAMVKKCPVESARKQAIRLVDFPFYRDNQRLKDSKTEDHELDTIHTFVIPDTSWKMAKDIKVNFHHKKVYAEKFDDSKWIKSRCGGWEKTGLGEYDGIAWYRIRFTMPEKMESDAVELSFQGVDEGSWIWLNGTYLGQHDVGPSGWDQPFALDCTKEIRWGRENLLVVRVEDTEAQGGIWKPVSVDVIKIRK